MLYNSIPFIRLYINLIPLFPELKKVCMLFDFIGFSINAVVLTTRTRIFRFFLKSILKLERSYLLNYIVFFSFFLYFKTYFLKSVVPISCDFSKFKDSKKNLIRETCLSYSYKLESFHSNHFNDNFYSRRNLSTSC